MAEVTLPLHWLSDLIHIPGREYEYLLVEWFLDEECTEKVIWCFAEYMRVRHYKLSEKFVGDYARNDLVLLLTETDYANMLIKGQYVKKCGKEPLVYKYVKKNNLFKEED